jgi:4-amino-4-deoxy-L-arabinose transferase-like glycosyltransferase
MSVNAAPVNQIPVQAKSTWAHGLLQGVAQTFQASAVAGSVEVAHRWWLLSFVCAAAFVRLWGLGSVGLHGDEETMAMAVRGILETGWPILPSGMFYPRGMIQLYLMAGSVALFGESEWALRIPSVICGTLLVGLAYLAGRRFLRPHWNLAFTVCVALSPSLIEFSQTARMYIFLIAAVMACIVCVFEWDRTGRLRWLGGAVAALMFGLDMHVLAVAVVLLLLVPGITRGDARRLLIGAVAAAAVVLSYFVVELWLASHYPTPGSDVAQLFGPDEPQRSFGLTNLGTRQELAIYGVGIAMALIACAVAVATRRASTIALSVSLLLIAVVFQLALFYHLAVLFYLAGAAVALRSDAGSKVTTRLIVLAVVAGLLAAIHVWLLAPKAGTLIRVIGAMVGQPSVWPYVRIAELNPIAGALCGALFLWGIYQFARSKPVPDYWLVLLLSVWAPLFALGALEWNPPPRYTAMSFAPMVLCAFAMAQRASDYILERSRLSAGRGALIAGIVAVAATNPPAIASTLTAGYRTHPDHQGAAEFIRSQNVSSEDIVIAEDVLQQTYYLGRVDYWLIGPHVAKQFVVRVGDALVDFYTHTPVIATTDMLDDVLQKSGGRRVFVIGSGEGWINGRRAVREGLQEALDSPRFESVYVGRDGLTRVLRAVPGKVRHSQETTEKSKADEAALEEHAIAVSEGTEPRAVQRP